MESLTRSGDDPVVRRFEDDGVQTIVVDVGARDASVDVVDGTAIVVVERDGEARQAELELPPGDQEAFMNNGVLTIEVRG